MLNDLTVESELFFTVSVLVPWSQGFEWHVLRKHIEAENKDSRDSINRLFVKDSIF